MVSLKIATINTWKCEGDYSERIKFLAKEMATLQADIILCQECFFCAEIELDTTNYLAEQLGMYKDYVAARKKKRYFHGKNLISESGLGILSKYRIVENTAVELPKVPGDDLRMLQKIVVDAYGIDIEVFNVHLTHIDTLENHRVNQTDFIIDQLKFTENIRIIGGDFNASPDSEEINRMVKLGKVIDVFKEKNPNSNRVSLVNSFEQGSCLNVDYLFVSQNKSSSMKIEIMSVKTILDKKNLVNNEYASDHFGVMAEFKIN